MEVIFLSGMFLISTHQLIEWGGLLIILLFIYAETGLLLGLVIPGGETLLFTAGFLVSTGTLETPLLVLLSSLILAAVTGDISGYFIGKKC
jgi:membrane-associated protein